MSVTDLVAIASAVIALAALAIGLRSLQLQRDAAKGDAQEQLGELIHKLVAVHSRMAQAGGPQSQDDGGAGSLAAQAILGEVQALALQADGVLRPSDGSPPDAQPDWYEAVVLAYAFADLWDLGSAGRYWDIAVALAHEPQATVITRRARGAYYYVRNGEGDVELGRRDFAQALGVLDPAVQGADMTHDQNFLTHMQQAGMEANMGNADEAASSVRAAWSASVQIRAMWRRQRAQGYLAGSLLAGLARGLPAAFDPPPELAALMQTMLVEQRSRLAGLGPMAPPSGPPPMGAGGPDPLSPPPAPAA